MRKQWRLITICCVLLLGAAFCPAQHDTHATGEDATADTARQPDDAHASAPGDGPHGKEAHDKPALLTFDPGAAIWSIIVFLVLLGLLRVTAWKPILRVLNERESFIHDCIEDAKNERDQAEQLLVEYKAQLEKARDEAAALIDQGRQDAEVVRQRMLEGARGETGEMTERARREIQLATDAAIKELYDRTAELSLDIAARIVGKDLNAADHSRLIEDSLAEIRVGGKAKLN
ncbi:MAG: F0F1 ATP synthase subunit B [Phycisphaerae bacterium]|nr:F0F1 ATP synthase subunit B [Phycisphaerae bacterium]